MGKIRTWRKLKVYKAVAEAASQTPAPGSPGPARPAQGLAAGFINVLSDALAPQLAATAERRGGPLPGSDSAVADGSAWTGSLAAATAAVQARDAAFDGVLLARFAEQVFAATVAVWTGTDAGSVRPVMSDALWEPLAAATGTGNRLNPLARLGQQRPAARVTGLHAGRWYDSALVAMQVRLVGDLPADMPAAMAAWDEEWLFQRSARPGGDPMIRPQACPSCGAPTRADEHDRCLHCREQVPYLTTGWLVTEIVSHHPSYAMARESMAENLRANPEAIARLSPEMIRGLPPEVRAAVMSRLPPGSRP